MKQTKKAMAFGLFSQGYLPKSKELKDIGLYSSNRYKYYYEWEALGKPTGEQPHHSQSSMVSTKSPGGENIGGIDETKPKPKLSETLRQEEQSPEGVEDEAEEIEEQPETKPEAEPEKPKAQTEGVGVVSEVITPKGKDGKLEGAERKIATTIADDGIKCVVFLSLQTLALFKIASSTQAQYDGGNSLLLGDFIDTCVEDYFDGRGKKLGLIVSGGR